MSDKVVVQSPEHVLIELRTAPLGARCAAFLLDAVLMLGLMLASGYAARLLPGSISALVATTADFLILWGYPVFFEVRWNGQTPGKRVLQLRTVDGRGLPVSLPQSLIRNVVRIVDVLPAGGVGLCAVLVTGHRQRLGDLAADTYVVSERQPGSELRLPRETRRFNSLRTPPVRRRVRHRLGLDEREFLYALCLRADALDERARYDLFESAGDHLRRKLAIDDPHLSGEAIVRGVAALCAGVDEPRG